MMKKTFVVLLVIVLSAQLLTAAFAQTSAQVSLSSETAMSGEEVVITVSVSNCMEAKSIYIVPQYDEGILEIVSGTWLLSGILSDDYSDTYGDAAIAFSSNTDINTNIFEFVFKVKENVQPGVETNVSCEIVIMTMEGKAEVPVMISVQHGSISVRETACDHSYGEWVTLVEPTQNEKGLRERTCIHCGHTEQEILDAITALPGDINGDGRLNVRDARTLLRYIAGLLDASEIELAAADYNGDGRVNVRDARALLRSIAGLD